MLPTNFCRGGKSTFPAEWPVRTNGLNPNLSPVQKEEFVSWLRRSHLELDAADFVSSMDWVKYFGMKTKNQYHRFSRALKKEAGLDGVYDRDGFKKLAQSMAGARSAAAIIKRHGAAQLSSQLAQLEPAFRIEDSGDGVEDSGDLLLTRELRRRLEIGASDALSLGLPYRRPTFSTMDDDFDKRSATAKQIITPEMFSEFGIQVFDKMPERTEIEGSESGGAFPAGTRDHRFFVVNGRSYVTASVEVVKSGDCAAGAILQSVEIQMREAAGDRADPAVRGKKRLRKQIQRDSAEVWTARAAITLMRDAASKVLKYQPIFESHESEDAQRFRSYQRQQCTSDKWSALLEEWRRANPDQPLVFKQLSVGISLLQELCQQLHRAGYNFNPEPNFGNVPVQRKANLSAVLLSRTVGGPSKSNPFPLPPHRDEFTPVAPGADDSTTSRRSSGRSQSQAEPEGSQGPEQSWHMDGDANAIILLMSMMSIDPTYFGVFLYSGSCMYEIRKLRDEYYKLFCEQFQSVPSLCGDGRFLKDVMPGDYEAEKLATAWTLWTQFKLHEKGYARPWRRAYIKLDEFMIYVGSMSVVHFGARYPMRFGDDALKPCDTNLWNLRLHLYIGDFIVPAAGGVVRDAAAQIDTLDIVSHPVFQAGLPYLVEGLSRSRGGFVFMK